MSTLLLLNGPNLDLLGTRETATYGQTTLPDVESRLAQAAHEIGHMLSCLQSNHEGELIDRVHTARTDGTAFILFNPGAFTHTSVALRDALLAVAIPFIEIHVSNVFARESFRHHSFFSDIASGVIIGVGTQGYVLALQAADQQLKEASANNH